MDALTNVKPHVPTLVVVLVIVLALLGLYHLLFRHGRR